MRLLFAIAICVLSAATSNAASRAEFDQLVQQVQARPNDNALRERVIKMAQELKPAPAIPEEAREQFVTGSAIAKAAKDASGQKLAIKKFNEALRIAPWWGDAYYNLAVAQELAGQFDGAVASLKLYILTNPSEKESREAQDRIYALKGKAELAKAEQAEHAGAAAVAADQRKQQAAASQAQAAAQEKEDLMRSLNGAVYGHRLENSGYVIRDYTIQISGTSVTNVRAAPFSGEPTETYRCDLKNLGCELFRWDGGYVVIEVQRNQVIEKDYFSNGSLADTLTYTRRN